MPLLTVVAGPNGSGKSTLTKALDFEGREHLLDPDAIARRLDPANPSRMAIAAGRELLWQMRRYMDERLSFAIETTLASKKTLNWIRETKSRGFTVKLIYICLDTPENNIVRVQERTSRGGHDVGDQDIRRRYHRSLAKSARGNSDRRSNCCLRQFRTQATKDARAAKRFYCLESS